MNNTSICCSNLSVILKIKLKESSDLYEIVLSLRVEPRKISKYPEHLEKLLELELQ
jgi:hypothetical protein